MTGETKITAAIISGIIVVSVIVIGSFSFYRDDRVERLKVHAQRIDASCELLERGIPVPEKAGRFSKYRCGKIIEWVWEGR